MIDRKIEREEREHIPLLAMGHEVLWIPGYARHACLYETGNIKKDNKVLRKKYDAYGKGLAMGVCSYLGIAW